jgi:hypothetical protein
MNDPFESLKIFDEFDASSISIAFAGAVARGVPLTEARAAMDALRDPVERSAAEILAPSMSQAARRLRSAVVAAERDQAIEIVLRALAYAADAIDRDLASTARRPSRADLVDQVLSPLPEHLEP